MEDENADLKHEEPAVLVENTETLDVSPPLESVQDREEETQSSPHNVAETAEDDVLEQEPQFSVEKQEGLLTEDKSMIPSDGVTNGPDTTELGPCEEEAEIGPKINEVIEDPDGEDLSHEDIITADDVEEKNKPQTPDSCMPDRERSSPSEEPPEEPPEDPPEEPPEVPVEEEELLKDLLHQLQEENDKLSNLNGQLQSKIAEYLSRKVDDDKQPKLAKDITDQQQYQNYMDLLEDLKCQHQCNLDLNQQRIQKLCQQSQEKLNQVNCELQSLALVKNEAAVTALTGKVGKQTTLEKVEQLLADEQKKEEQLVCVRLCNIKLKNKLCKFEATLQSQRKLTDGLLLMDFEQLKTENRTIKERFKDRNGELLRLHNKIACSVQGITHIKEKLHFIQKENMAKHTQLAEVDAVLALKRDVLTHTRQARDNLRIDNLKLQQRCGLLGNTTLLRDFEERVDTSESLQQGLETMKRRHAELVLKCAGVKQKIEQSKPEYK